MLDVTPMPPRMFFCVPETRLNNSIWTHFLVVLVDDPLELGLVVLVDEDAGQHLLGPGEGDFGRAVDGGVKPLGETPKGFKGL